jgi:surface antigen
MGAGMRVFSMVAVSWALALPGWATVSPHERAAMDVGRVLDKVLEARAGESREGAIGTVMRAVVKALLGEAMARSMDNTDLMMTLLALENDRAGVRSRWRNPHTGNLYSVTSTRTYDASGRACLEYSTEAVIGGKQDKVHGTACRQKDGSWTK